MARCCWPDVAGLNLVDDVEAARYQGEFGRSDIPSLNSYGIWYCFLTKDICDTFNKLLPGQLFGGTFELGCVTKDSSSSYFGRGQPAFPITSLRVSL